MHCSSCQAPNPDNADVCIVCGKGLYALTRGTILAKRYQIIDSLGKGGMGIVYKAHDLELDEVVALKVLRADIAKAPQIARRFTSEIKLARKVRHRNVCGIHEYHQDGSLRFIAMELIQGVDFRKILKQHGALPPKEAYDVAMQVVLGLEAIHEVGIIHRDLKTSNLMRDARGVVRLMDFGIAKEYDSQELSGLTATGQIVGTPEYMSPEQAQGQRIDVRSDLYALGVVVFELFTGEVPFQGATPVVTMFKHIREPPPLDGPRATALPPDLVPVLRKALEKDPAHRFATAREMAEALSAARARSFPEARVPRTEPVGPVVATETLAAVTPQALPTVAPDSAGAPRPADWPIGTTAVPAVSATRPQVTRSTARLALSWPLVLALVAIAVLVGVTGSLYVRLAGTPVSVPAQSPLPSATLPPATTLPPVPAASPFLANSATRLEALDRLADRDVVEALAQARKLSRQNPESTEIRARIARYQAAAIEHLVSSGQHALKRASITDDRSVYEEALRAFEEALALDPSHAEALRGRADANRRIDDLRTRSAAIVFVQGETAFNAPSSAAPPGMAAAPPGVVIRPAQAPAPRAQLVIEATPSVIRPKDAFVLRYSLFNLSAAPLTVGSVSVRNALGGGGVTGGSIEPQSRTAPPKTRTLLIESKGTWSYDPTTEWATTLTVVLDDGSVYSSTLRAQRQ